MPGIGPRLALLPPFTRVAKRGAARRRRRRRTGGRVVLRRVHRGGPYPSLLLSPGPARISRKKILLPFLSLHPHDSPTPP